MKQSRSLVQIYFNMFPVPTQFVIRRSTPSDDAVSIALQLTLIAHS